MAKEKINRGTDNVLADLGIENAGEISTKVSLAVMINRIIDHRHLNQESVAGLLGIPQPKVSSLRNFKLEGFSVERLMKFLTALGRDVEIRVKKKPHSRPEGRIMIAAAG